MANQYCANCGSQLKQGAKFCAKCGHPVSASSAIDSEKKQESNAGNAGKGSQGGQENLSSTHAVEGKERTEKYSRKNKKSSKKKWVAALVSLVILLGGGYVIYDSFFSQNIEEASNAQEEDEGTIAVEDFYGYWSAEDGSVLFIDESNYVYENNGDILYNEVISFNLEEESSSAAMVVQPFDTYLLEGASEENREEQILTLEEGNFLKVEIESAETSEFESISEEDYLSQGGSDLYERSQQERQSYGESQADSQGGEDAEDQGEAQSDFQAELPQGLEEDEEEISSEQGFDTIEGYYLDSTEYGEFVYYISEEYIGSYLYNPDSESDRWTIIEVEQYTFEENQLNFEGLMLNDVIWAESEEDIDNVSLENYSDEFIFNDSTATLGLNTAGYAQEYTFMKLRSTDELINIFGEELGDPYWLIPGLYEILLDVKN